MKCLFMETKRLLRSIFNQENQIIKVEEVTIISGLQSVIFVVQDIVQS